ncbi:hypothetical protein A2W16_03885 [Candidatus Amesbacteria bacterium RBG_16_48_31]|nr:MAG: hypothetical protein A2W16_03885 [Candidatus Amesbacteria bacterium RBG_16_48_31]
MSPEDESLVTKELRALRRRRKLRRWLNGEGPRTEEEKKLAATYFDTQVAKIAIALNRQSHASQSLHGGGSLPDAEQQLASQSQLIRYLSGDKDAGIDKDK